MDQDQRQTVYFAKTNFRGAERTFGIRTRDRRQHMYVVGKTGVGKTNLLKHIALQDIANGAGVAIIDPHGSFVEEVLERIPASRKDDVIYINPIDMEFPIGFNVLEVPDPKYKHLVASDLMAIFTKIWANVWSARMEYILSNCVLALLDTPGTTLLGIPRLLVDKEYRSKIIENVKDPVVRSFWVHEYESWRDQFRNEAIVPIQNKVGQFLSTPMIRNMVGQEQSSFNVYEIMNQGKILLVNVSKGRIGEDNAGLLGAMIITKIQLAAMERVRIPEDERKDFYLYVDEFQNFATESFATILSEARKYRLNIVIAHQYIGQLVTDTSTKVRDAVFGNVGSMIVFRVGAADAEYLEKEFEPEFDIQDLVNIPNHHIYIKLMVNGVTSRPFSARTVPAAHPGGEGAPDLSADIIAHSRAVYGRSRADVEREIGRWSGVIGDDGSSAPAQQKAGDERYAAVCSNCGKNTHVNFRPDGRRPVYCSDCLKKVQAGEIAPLPSIGATKASFGDSLAELGIEFSLSKKSRDEKKSAPASIKGSVPVARSLPEKTLSLSELMKQTQHVKRPKEHAKKSGSPDLGGLKKALKDALKSGGNSPIAKSAVSTEKETDTLEPGQTVRV